MPNYICWSDKCSKVHYRKKLKTKTDKQINHDSIAFTYMARLFRPQTRNTQCKVSITCCSATSITCSKIGWPTSPPWAAENWTTPLLTKDSKTDDQLPLYSCPSPNTFWPVPDINFSFLQAYSSVMYVSRFLFFLDKLPHSQRRFVFSSPWTQSRIDLYSFSRRELKNVNVNYAQTQWRTRAKR